MHGFAWKFNVSHKSCASLVRGLERSCADQKLSQVSSRDVHCSMAKFPSEIRSKSLVHGLVRGVLCGA